MPILVDNCEHYELWPNLCRKCGRSMPEVCLESEERAGTAFQQENTTSTAGNADVPVAGSDSDMANMDEPTPVVRKRGRPKGTGAPISAENTAD